MVAYLWKALAGDRSLLLANFCCRVVSVPWHDYFVYVFSAFPDPFGLLILPSSGFNVFAYKKKRELRALGVLEVKRRRLRLVSLKLRLGLRKGNDTNSFKSGLH